MHRAPIAVAAAIAPVAALTAPPAAIAAPPAYHTAVAAANPSIWYQFNETTGNAHNYGSLGSGFDAVYNGTVGRGAPTYSGDAGARFDTPDDFLQSIGSSPLTGNPTFSAEAIVRL